MYAHPAVNEPAADEGRRSAGVVGHAGGEAGSVAEMANLRGVSESVQVLCDGVLAHPMGFRLSGFIVTPKLAMQVLYAAASILFLVLVGRGGAVSV